MVAYAVALAAYTELLGIPNDTISVFVWLWFGTIAWNIEAPWRYHLRFVRDWSIPMVGLVIYFYSRGLTDELGLPVHYTMPIRFDEWLSGVRRRDTCRPCGSSSSSAVTRACGERPALVRRLLHHRLRQPLPDRADHRRGAVGPQPRGVAALDAPLRRHQLRRPRLSTSSTRWHRRGWPPRRATSTRPSPGSPDAAGATSAWAGSTSSSRASATRSPRCRRCTPASRSWWRCTASGGCARRCGTCSSSTRSPCP